MGINELVGKKSKINKRTNRNNCNLMGKFSKINKRTGMFIREGRVPRLKNSWTNLTQVAATCDLERPCGLHYFVRKILLENFQNILLEIVPRKNHLVESIL